MFRNEELIRCQRRKEALLQQSALHRRTLLADAQNVRPLAEWVDLGISLSRKLRSGWTALAPLLSLWPARKQESSGFVHKIAGAVSLARSLTALWKNWR